MAEVKEKIKNLFKEKINILNVSTSVVKNYLGNDYAKEKRKQYDNVDKKLEEKVCGSELKMILKTKPGFIVTSL